ncbi:ABC transporter substrate-binding protein [Spirochaeta cellobiosiphila]|uniref:ABC transporter substrate-binding protein n=1 Tax=Spirochaeta cellobiosiphila TaxID=504483 RepID=UPI0004235449|nr:ABC transporter substrate-binding protein [Spirochaeta cellobiosiphila]
MPKKGIVIYLTVFMLLSGVTWNIFGNGQKTEDSNQPVIISMAFPIAVDAPITELLNGYAKEYMDQHPNVKIDLIYSGGYTDVKTMIQTTIDGGGEAPSLAVMLATDLFDLANAQYIEPMTPYTKKLKSSEMKDFLPAFMENSYYMDDVWSLPFQRSAVVLYYNADLLAEKGLAVPKDWKSLAETAQALTVKEGDSVTRWGLEWPTGWPYWVFQPLAIGAGQNIVGDEDDKVYFDNADVIKAIKYYNSLSADYGAMPQGVQVSWGNVVPNFVSGNTAMIVQSSGSLSGVLSQAKFKVGVMGVPGEKGGYFSVPGGGNIYMISGMSEAEKKAAFDFALFLTAPSRAADFSIATGYVASRKSSMEEEAMKAYVADHPQVLDVQNVLAQAGKEMALQNLGEVRSIFHNYIQAAFNGEMTPEEAMAKAQEEADAALVDFQ